MNAWLRCLERMDVDGLMTLHRTATPHLPAPASRADALVVLHMARTQSEALSDGDRFYSHRWLEERGLPSQLPDALKPRADRVYPKVVSAVGISVNASGDLFKPLIPLVRGAMEAAVYEADADGRLLDTAHVTARMREARQTEIRKLLGRVTA